MRERERGEREREESACVLCEKESERDKREAKNSWSRPKSKMLNRKLNFKQGTST